MIATHRIIHFFENLESFICFFILICFTATDDINIVLLKIGGIFQQESYFSSISKNSLALIFHGAFSIHSILESSFVVIN